MNRLNGLLSEDAVSTTYEAVHLADASQKAVNLIETRGIDAARKMIDGEVPTEDGVLRTALMIEYEQKMLVEGNVEEYTCVLRRRLGHVSVQAVIESGYKSVDGNNSGELFSGTGRIISPIGDFHPRACGEPVRKCRRPARACTNVFYSCATR